MMMTMLITDDSTQTRLGVAGVGKNRAGDCRDGSCQGDLIVTMSYIIVITTMDKWVASF